MKRLSDEELAEASRAVQAHSYSPYSQFRVGAALEGELDVYTGTNVENRSYGLTICAERSAVFAAVSRGESKFSRLAIASPTAEFVLPCGACLQVLAEFCDELPIVLTNKNGELRHSSLAELYPHRFRM